MWGHCSIEQVSGPGPISDELSNQHILDRHVPGHCWDGHIIIRTSRGEPDSPGVLGYGGVVGVSTVFLHHQLLMTKTRDSRQDCELDCAI